MGRIRLIVLCIISSVLLNSCFDSGSDKPVKDADSVQVDTLPKDLPVDTVVVDPNPIKIYALTQADKSVLELLQTIEMGFSFNEVKAKYPSVKGIRPEDKKDELASAGYTESVCKQAVFGGEASVEFNFKDDSLYAYSFSYNDKSSDKTEQVFQAVKKYYSTKWGAAQLENVEEDDHYNQNFIWTGQKSFYPYLNYNLNNNTIIWGRKYEKAL